MIFFSRKFTKICFTDRKMSYIVYFVHDRSSKNKAKRLLKPLLKQLVENLS